MRHSLPENRILPDRLFDLKRCMLVSRIKLDENGRELVVVNLHLSAFDDGKLKAEQIRYVRKFLETEYAAGNFVIAGGDWNHSAIGLTKEHFGKYTTSEENLKWLGEIDESTAPDGWVWGFDISSPSVRTNEKGYVKGENFTTVVDGFLLSPGITVNFIRVESSDFEFSDHEPVLMEIEIF